MMGPAAVSAFPERVVGSACALSFSRIAQRSLALRPALALSPIRDTLIEGFSHFVTSMTAPIASGWSGCRVGLAPTGKRRLSTAHTQPLTFGLALLVSPGPNSPKPIEANGLPGTGSELLQPPQL